MHKPKRLLSSERDCLKSRIFLAHVPKNLVGSEITKVSPNYRKTRTFSQRQHVACSTYFDVSSDFLRTDVAGSRESVQELRYICRYSFQNTLCCGSRVPRASSAAHVGRTETVSIQCIVGRCVLLPASPAMLPAVHPARKCYSRSPEWAWPKSLLCLFADVEIVSRWRGKAFTVGRIR